MIVWTKARHIAEAERVLDAVRDRVLDPADLVGPELVVAAAEYARAHVAIANAYPGDLEFPALDQARKAVA